MEVTVGLDVGGTKILAVALDRAGNVLASDKSPTPTVDPGALLAALGDAIDGVVAQVPDAQLAAVGIGLPGFLSPDGVPQQAPNLPASVGLDVRGPLTERAGAAVVVDNDANCAAWASFAVDTDGATSVVAITFGTGIGGGIVVDGQLLHGANGFAGEPGHMIVDVNGPLCVCGQHGCWEMYASGNGLGRLARAAVTEGRGASLLAAVDGDVALVDGPIVGRLATNGNPEAAAILDDYAGWIAVGLVNLINLLDPAVIVLGGGVVELGDVLLSRVRGALDSYPTMIGGRSTPVRLSSLGPSAGAVGAALLAAETLTGGPWERR
jgi:glucokinase